MTNSLQCLHSLSDRASTGASLAGALSCAGDLAAAAAAAAAAEPALEPALGPATSSVPAADQKRPSSPSSSLVSSLSLVFVASDSPAVKALAAAMPALSSDGGGGGGGGGGGALTLELRCDDGMCHTAREPLRGDAALASFRATEVRMEPV